MRMPDLKGALERSQRPSFIHGLRLEEVSGVDHPAHMQEGWTVLKARRSGSKITLSREVLDYAVVAKSVNGEKKYTLGLLYAASTKDEVVQDAHGESISADELYQARLDYVRGEDRSIHLQHGMTDAKLMKIGEWVDIVQWPESVEAEFKLPNGKTTEATIPANSVWMGVLWNDIGWKLVKSGVISGLSLGGYRKKSEETGMAKSEEPIKDALEGYTLRGVAKANPDGSPSKTNTGDADRPLTAPVAPVEKPDQFSYPQLDPKLIDHKPRLNQRLKDFLASFETTLSANRYRALLQLIIDFSAREATAQLPEDHVANALFLATTLRAILPSEHDQVSTLKHFVPTKVLKEFALKGMTQPGTMLGVVNNAIRKFNASKWVEQDVKIMPGQGDADPAIIHEDED